MWELTFGSCVLLEDGCLTTANFPDPHDGGSCVVAINPEWTGFLFADYMSMGYVDLFTVDGQDVEVNFFWMQAPPHGMAPRHTVVWSPGQSSYGRWKLCQVNALPPWTVKEGHCQINLEGCFETEHFRLQRFFNVSECSSYHEYCVVEISADWQGTLDVVDATFPHFEGDYIFQWPSVLTVNGQAYSLSSSEDLALTGVQGMVARGTFSWTQDFQCHGLKMCPHAHTTLPGPWGDDPWTCTVLGDPCTLPFDFNGVSFNACTQQLSDSYDVDEDGSLHNGHPQCQSATGLSLCGPCSCAAGEEQSYNMSSVYPHTLTVGLVACAPCAVGRFQSLGGSGTLDSCEMCPPGASSLSGATACTNCLPGMFNDYDSLECASCQPGFFGFSMGLTMCQECAVGSYTATEQQTACDGCLDGSVLIAKNVGCQQCLPGAFLSQSMTACSPCDAGRFQNASGQSECYQCSAALHTEGSNSGLWTTMSRIENVGWRETSGSRSVRDCGCAEGAWVDALGQCRECGEGITCKGMGEVEVLPGYFASADNPGFVWRCHGADWARCPGGRPGTCAQQRLNTSVACEECEPDTRMTNDGPCKARCVLLAVGRPSSYFVPSLRFVLFSRQTKQQLFLNAEIRRSAGRSEGVAVQDSEGLRKNADMFIQHM